MVTLGCLGISYRTAGASLRDRVSFTAETGLVFLDRLADLGVRQGMVLSTCNRCEVFFIVGEGGSAPETALSVVRAAYLAEFAGAGCETAVEERTGVEAMTYLFRIAAGLESMILGEYQILGQVKEAYAAALAHGRVGKPLDRILREAIACAKRVKSELDLGAVPPSVCRAGVELVEARVGFAGKSVFVIGSGKTGSLAARLAVERGARRLCVCNRSPERARHLERECGARVVDYATRYGTIAESDVVISATASPHLVVRAGEVKLSKPTVFLDLASPRDVDEALRENPFVTLFSIDSIGELAAGDRAERERLTAQGMAIVDGGVKATAAWLSEGGGA